MKIVVVDTNIFLRLLLNDIPLQTKASERLLKQAKRGIVLVKVAQIVLFEINFILDKYYSFKKEVRIEKLKVIVATDYLNIESRDIFEKALQKYSENRVSFVDAFLSAKALIEEAELFTFDKKLKKIKTTL